MILAAGRVIGAAGEFAPGHVVVQSGLIAAVGEGIPPDADRIFPTGTLVPGFVDLQLVGSFGVDLLTADEAQVEELSRRLAATGTTGFLATLVSAPMDRLHGALRTLRRARPIGAVLLGVHLEGPVLNPARCGAHDPRHLRAPDDPEVWRLIADALPDLQMCTLAPELPGVEALIRWLVQEGVVVAIGHTDATYEEARRALAQARMATHLFNAMRGLHHREPGVVGAALEDPRCLVGLIPDGVHVHPAVIRLVYRLVGPDRVVLTTDACAAAGMPPGTYTLGGREVSVGADGVPRLPDGKLAGSSLRMDQGIANLVRWGIPLADAVRSAATIPARLLGLADRGAIAPGMRADLCVLDEDFRAVLTLVGGAVVHEAVA
ncbi:MAG: N-acetylglucosamine-6-phosphate deacetylase [Armatimonadota bacterium]|nr:N-acetylglucosamine-6-phosphate deacetylase [Armatimonadota bacterium]MDR7563291.1 N-acetylglucosamine-6-phosphate deacetylase [Armatimonadota bacterium]MDR7567761.1 N-acetylglucosamine-6-phosphate deacetylase [Armatimonadota bacterium]MDR7602645.1 N-acetylglucosamine-6-phosphate deacetylase [Armatimonadota bacterium]